MKYTCIIVDDEPLSHNVLKSHLQNITDVHLAAEFTNAIDARNYLDEHPVDLLLLDIQMPEITGLDFLRSLETRPVTIITTAFRDYALEGFELGVIDYLLKPIEFERFSKSLARALDFLQLVKTGDSIDFNSTEDTHSILIKTGTKKVMLDYRTIVFAQGLKDYTILHTDSQKYVVKGSVKAFEEYLPQEKFIRVHKSFIVARHLIKVIYKNKIELESVSIPIGRSFRETVDAALRAN